MKIVSVTRNWPTPDDPSQGVFVFRRVTAMARRENVIPVQPIPHFPVLRPLPSWSTIPDASIRRTPMFYLPGVLKSLDAQWLGRSIRSVVSNEHAKGKIDAIDAHFGYPDGAACVAVGRGLDVPVFITLRGVEAEQIRERFVGGQLRHALHSADGCICVSHFLAELAVRNGADERKLRVIHNAIDRSVFKPACDIGRAEMDLPIDRPIVVSVGHLVPRKRHHVMVQAMATLRKNGLVLPYMVIIGGEHQDGQYVARLKSLVTELDLTDSVRFLGNRPPAEVARWMSLADAFMLLSAREGCCNAVLEALGCGLPVIATRVGDNAHFVEDGVNGRIVEVDSVDDAARGLAEVLGRMPWDRTKISSSLKVGSWDDVAGQVLSFMRESISAS